jgi:hypothetical protein
MNLSSFDVHFNAAASAGRIPRPTGGASCRMQKLSAWNRMTSIIA